MSDESSSATAPAADAPANEGSENNEDQTLDSETSPSAKTDNQSSKRKPPQYRKYKIGEEEVSLSDEDIARSYQKWKGADQKFREANQARQSVDQFMKALQENPEEVLNDPRLSFDRKKLAENWLIKQLEQELNPADPREQKLAEYERQLKAFQEKEAKEKQTKEESERQAVLEQRKSAIGETLHKAMEMTHLSAHPESAAATLREMAMYMRAAKERGEDVTPEEIVEHVHNSRFNQFYTLAHQYDGDELIEFLGDEIVNRIRKADLARLRANRAGGESFRSEETYRPSSNAPSTKMDPHAAKMMVRKKLLGK